jgi:transposase
VLISTDVAMRPRGSARVLAKRRKLALALLAQGLSLREVARRIGCAASSVMRWREPIDPWVEEVRSSPGRPRKITVATARKLVGDLMRGAAAWGEKTDTWTTLRIARLLYKRYKTDYHPDHVGRLLHDLGWHYQDVTGWVPGPDPLSPSRFHAFR